MTNKSPYILIFDKIRAKMPEIGECRLLDVFSYL